MKSHHRNGAPLPTDHKTERRPTDLTTKRYEIAGVAMNWLQLGIVRAFARDGYIVFAVRVGALDGRHPEAGEQALQRIVMVTNVGARLFIDGGDPLRELPIPEA